MDKLKDVLQAELHSYDSLLWLTPYLGRRKALVEEMLRRLEILEESK